MVSVSVKELAPDTHGNFHRWVVQVDNQTVENFYFNDHGGRANAYDEAYRYARKLEKAQNMQVRDKTEEWDMRERSTEMPDPTDELVKAINVANAEEAYRETIPPGYRALWAVLTRALEQAAYGKGKERHADGKPFSEQIIMQNTREFGIGSPLGQVTKKAHEAIGMHKRGQHEQAKAELLGAINFCAAAYLGLCEIQDIDDELDIKPGGTD